MTSKTLFGKLASAGCTLIAAIGIGRAQTVTITDIGPAIPTLEAIAVVQTNYPVVHGNPSANLNYYFDAANPPGSTFLTPSANAGGYVLNSVAFKTMDDSGTSASFSTSQTYVLSMYYVSGTLATLIGTYTSQAITFTEFDWLQFTGVNLPVSANATYAYTIHRSSTGWENLGWTNGLVGTTSRACAIPPAGGTITFATDTTASGTFDVGLSLPTSFQVGPLVATAANPVLVGTAVTLSDSAIVDNVTGSLQYQWMTDGGGGGTLTNIPLATSSTYLFNTAGIAQTNLGNYVFALKVTDSTSATLTSPSLTVNVYQRQLGTLTLSTTAPSPGADDAYNLNQPPSGTVHQSGSLNYYTDAGANNNPAYVGMTFTTLHNPQGYTLGSVNLKLDGATGPGAPNYGYAGTTVTNVTYTLYLYKISADQSTATLIGSVTNWSIGALMTNYPTWVNITLSSPISLLPDTVYGYGFGRGSIPNSTAQLSTTPGGGLYASMETSDATQDWYPGGQIAGFPAAGGTIIYSTTGGGVLDGTFDVELDPLGLAFILNAPVVAPNPAYALSPVQLTASAKTPGTYTYQWFAEDDFNSVPPTPIPGGNGLTVTVIPMDLVPNQPGYTGYTTNFYFVATRTTDNVTVTSSIVTLTVKSASAPVLTDPTPANLVTFVGGSVTYAAGEAGTLPITNQWQFDNGLGGGYVPLTLKTNSTLVLSNVQTTNSGNYELMATNLLGHTNTDAVNLTVLADPAAPDPATQIYANMANTNHPWAYWRLNETGNPVTTNLTAYDYSGHGFFAAYGNAVTVANAGPVPPSFPGFAAGHLAAGTALATANSHLTVPALNLAGKSNVTFMAWINPSGTQPANAGLLFYRNGSDAAGFGFGGTSHLGYTWNNNASATYNWDSGLAPAVGQWNFVVYVITPTNTTVYLGNLSGGTNFYQSSNPVANGAETFTGGTILLGSDSGGAGDVRNFNGLICEATLFTNALTTLQVQQYFQAAVGATSLAPSGVSSITVAPVAATGAGVYSGQNVRMSAGNASGTFPITNRWQVSADGSTWLDVAGVTDTALLVNPQTVGTFHYQLVVGNIAATVTSSPVVVTFTALPATPPGLWTVNFQTTNNIGPGQSTVSGGLGHYVGRGILGNGTYWNPVPQLLGGYSAGNIGSVSGLLDDGVTNSGIYCFMGSGGAYNSLGSLGGGTLAYSSDIGNLLDQFYRTYYSGGVYSSALRFYGVPAGTYNLVCYGANGSTINGAGNLGTTFVVFDSVNGTQTNSTAQASPATDALAAGLNFCIFTNVHVSGGQLNVDVLANAAVAGSSACMEGAQLQLVSYDNPPTNSASVSGTLTAATNNPSKTISLNWNQGVLQTTTNLLTPWTSINTQAPGLSGALGTPAYSVTFTNGIQFFRVQVHP